MQVVDNAFHAMAFSKKYFTAKTSMLLDKNLFEGLDNTVHLSAGGETPMLHSHRDAFEKFMHDKARGEKARSLIHETLLKTREQCCLLYTSPSPRDGLLSRMPSSA